MIRSIPAVLGLMVGIPQTIMPDRLCKDSQERYGSFRDNTDLFRIHSSKFTESLNSELE